MTEKETKREKGKYTGPEKETKRGVNSETEKKSREEETES